MEEKKDAEGYFKRAVEFHKNGEFSSAARMYKNAIEIDPENKRAHVLLGNVSYHLGELKESLRRYKRAIELDPEYATAFFNLGSVYEDLGDMVQAKESFQKATEIDPNYAEAFTSLGNVLKSLGDVNEAIRCFQRAMEIDKELEAPKKGIEELMEDIHEQVKVKEITKTAEELIKDGIVFEDEGDLDRAIKKYNEAVRVNPNSLIGYVFLGIAQEKAGSPDTASTCYQKILGMDPEIATRGISMEILEILKKRMYIQNTQELVNLIKGFNKAAEQKKDLSLFEFMKRDIKSPEALLKEGAELEVKGDIDGAIVRYREAITRAPHLPTPYYFLGLALEKKGEVEEALKYYKKAVDLDMGIITPEATKELGELLATKIGNLYLKNMDTRSLLKDFNLYAQEREGSTSLEDFIRLKITGDAEKHIQRGYLLDVEGASEEAVKSYQQAVEIDPNNVVAHYILGLSYESRGEYDLAMEQYEKTSDLDLSKAAKEISPEVMKVLENYLNMTTKDGHRVGMVLRRYFEIISENPDKMTELLGYIEDINLDSISGIIKSHMRGGILTETGGRIIRDQEDFQEDYEKERLRKEKAKQISKEPFELIWKYKTGRTIRCSAISVDGSRIAGGSENGNIYFLGETGELLWKFKAEEKIIGVDISPDRDYVIACTAAGKVILLNARENGEKVWEQDFREAGPTCISISSRAENIVLGSRDFQAILLNNHGRVRWKYQLTGFCSDVAISSDGSTILVCTQNEIHILKNRELRPVSDSIRTRDPSYSVGISPDGRFMAVGTKNSKLLFFDDDRNLLWQADVTGQVYGVAVSHNGEYITCGTAGSMIYFYDKGGKQLWKYPTGINVWDVDISDEGDRVVGGCGLVFGNVYLFSSM
jgi:tetratricopeptide (TPR) repeat protein